MRIVVVILLLVVGGCATTSGQKAADACVSFGLKPGTQEYASCFNSYVESIAPRPSGAEAQQRAYFMRVMEEISNRCLSYGLRRGSPEHKACYDRGADEFAARELGGRRGANTYDPPAPATSSKRTTTTCYETMPGSATMPNPIVCNTQ